MLTLCLLVVVSTAKAELLPYPTDTIKGQIVYRYEVPKSIGLYRISVNFGVTQEEIIKWNPQLKERGLRYAETILIPAKDIEPSKESAAQETAVQETAPKEIAPVAEEPKPALKEQAPAMEAPVATMPAVEAKPALATEIPAAETPLAETPAEEIPVAEAPIVVPVQDSTVVFADTIQAMKIAVLLPLQADAARPDAGTVRFVEFYEGVLLAINDLQQEQPFELFVYDIGKTDIEINTLVRTNKLAGMNAIIGPAYPSQVEAISDFALHDSIPVLIPFTNKVKNITNNPFLMQFNPDVKSDAKAFADYLLPQKDSINFVFVEAKEADIPYAIREIRQALRNRDMSITRVSVQEILKDSISKALKDSMENVLIFTSEKYSSIQFLLPHVLKGKGNASVTLFSQYSWQKEKIIFPQIYTSVFTTDVPADLTHYESMYNLYFKQEHSTELPRFDLLGYDITRQLIAWLQGKEYFGLQSDMRFEQITPSGGFVNTKVTVIRK